MKAQVVDVSRDSLAYGRNPLQRSASERRFAGVSRNEKSVIDVRRCLGRRKLIQSANDRNALSQLHESFAGQRDSQLGLPRENDLHQFSARRFKVGEHSQRFQDRILQVLRFVHYQHKTSARLSFADKNVVQLALQMQQVIILAALNSEVRHKRPKKLPRIALRLEQESRARRVPQLPQ